MKGIKNIIFDFNKENLTDSSFKQSITMSVVGIILCMIALCSTTFAWFNASVSSNTNSIQAANCIVTVSVANSGTAEDIANSQYTFKKDTIYDVTVTASGTAKSAYCIFYVKGAAYYAELSPIETNGNCMNFKLMFKDDTQCEIVTLWGTQSLPAASQAFENGESYLDCEKVPSFPVIVPEIAPTTETIVPETNNTKPANSEIRSAEEPSETGPATQCSEVTE